MSVVVIRRGIESNEIWIFSETLSLGAAHWLEAGSKQTPTFNVVKLLRYVVTLTTGIK